VGLKLVLQGELHTQLGVECGGYMLLCTCWHGSKILECWKKRNVTWLSTRMLVYWRVFKIIDDLNHIQRRKFIFNFVKQFGKAQVY
jgi:hypothetical protein